MICYKKFKHTCTSSTLVPAKDDNEQKFNYFYVSD